MLTIMTALALAGAAQIAPANAQPMQMQGMDMSHMDHSKMDHSQMAQSKNDGCDCCKKTADGKMECDMSKKDGTASAHQDHSNH